jgi:hypothetical protein
LSDCSGFLHRGAGDEGLRVLFFDTIWCASSYLWLPAYRT